MNSNLRRSCRSNFGQPPLRYGGIKPREVSGRFSETELELRRSSLLHDKSTQPAVQNAEEVQSAVNDGSVRRASATQSNKTSTHSKTGRSTCSSILKRRILEAKLKAAEEQAQLEKEKEERELERQKNLIELKLKLTEAEIEEEENLCQSGASISVKDFETSEDERQRSTDKVANWIQTNPNDEDKRRTEKIDFLLARQTCQKELPYFSGDPTEWPRFLNALRRSTKICGYTDADNIDRLDRCLKGKARAYVESLLMVPDNFETVILLLQRRYGQPKFIINTLIDRAKQALPPKDGNFESLIEYSSVVRNLAATAETLNCEHYMTNPQLLEELSDKLPYNLKLKWGKQLSRSTSGFVSLIEFSNWLNSISDRAIMVHTPKFDIKSDRSEKQNNKKQIVCVTTTTKKDSQENQVVCDFCQKNFHNIENCHQFKKKDLNSRWQFVRDKKLCFSCLKPDHCIFDCKNKKECNILKCKRHHHPILHDNSNIKDDSNKKIETCSQITEISCQVQSENLPTKQVFLQILPIILHGPNGSLATFAMLDSGSTVTLIEADLCKRLGIHGEICPLSYKGLNPTVQRETDSQKVTLKISSSSGEKSFSLRDARTVKNLSLPKQSISQKQIQKWKHLKHINISEINNAHPKVLIGQDNANLIIPLKCIRGPSNAPVAAKTELGWVLSGKIDNFPTEIQENFFVRHNEEDDQNVADEATRNNFKCDLSQNSRWLNGPEFLRQESSEWPKEKEIKHSSDVESFSEEIKTNEDIFLTVLNDNESLPNIDRFSSWTKLIRATAWVLHFVNCCQSPSTKSTMLKLTEIEKAKRLWCKQSQFESFPADIGALKSDKPLPISSRLRQLSPFLDEEGILRLRSRIKMAPNINIDVKFPIILDPNHRFTKLLIHWYHVKMGHNGRETVLNELRQQYWILNARAAVRRSWNQCQICKNLRVKPQVPEMGLLPPERITSHVRPFAFTGIDYFGPFEVTIKRSHEKRYGVLFTCLTTRAVHLEIASSLTTDSCIMAIRRFISRRGYPSKMFSDNGTNLKGSEKELKEALENLNQAEINDKLMTRGIEWKFIPPASPHMGGSWERLVQSVKTALKTTLKQRYPKEETLQTLFAEAENIINSRPLTFVSLDSKDEEALTPNHFLLGSSSSSPVPGVFEDVDVSLRKQWRVAQRLADHFWQRWVKEYLPTLLRRDKWTKPVRPVKIGDVCVIADPSLQRNYWPKGVVTATHPGPDGLTRVADVQTATGTFRRPVTKIGVLDVR